MSGGTLDDFLDAAERAGMAKLRAKKPGAPREAAPKKRANPEREAQRAIVAWLRRRGCVVQATFTEQAAASSDPGKRARFGAARKATGATTGFPDLTLVTPGGQVAFIEVKAARTGRVSDAQEAMIAELRGRGCVVVLATDIWTAETALLEAGIALGHPRLRPAVPAEPLR